jgi:ankyrin repeat protein
MNKLIRLRDANEIRDSIEKIIRGKIIIPEEDNSKVFLWACENGYLEIVKVLIAAYGFDSLNIVDCYGDKPIPKNV